MAKPMSTRARTASCSSDCGIPQLELPQIQSEQLSVFMEIGKGRFKTVSSGCHTRHGAAAILRYKADSNRNEIQILNLLTKHGASGHIPEVYGVRRETSGWLVAQELSSFGSVRSALQEDDLASMMTPEHKLYMATQFAEAVSFLESVRIVHTDLACRNFLIFRLEDRPDRTKVKLTDFMSSLCLTGNEDHVVRKLPQATRWCAPETVASNVWSYKTDVWSLGVTLWELFTGEKTPWQKYTKRADVAKKLRELTEKPDAFNVSVHPHLSIDFPAPESILCPELAYSALLSCLQPDANVRPSSKRLATTFSHLTKARVQAAENQSPQPAQVAEIREAQLTLDKQVSSLVARAPANVVAPPSESDDGLSSTPPSISRSNEQNNPSSYAWTPSKSPSKESLTKVSTSCSTPVKSGICAPSPSTTVTPPTTRCSSTPGSPGVCTRLLPHQQETLENIKALCSSPHVPMKPDTVASIQSFLSSPEAVCGLGAEKLIYLRRKLAAAKGLEEQPRQALPRGMPVCDTLIYPPTPLAPLNSWIPGPPRTPGCALRDPTGREFNAQPWSPTLCCM